MKISDIMKSIGNQFASIASDGVSAGDVSSFYDTGSYALNALISGSIYQGMPSNKLLLCGAPSSTGKTFFALSVAANFQKDQDDGIVIIFESESAITKQMLAERGFDLNRVLIVPVTTVEEFRTQCLKFIEDYDANKDKDKPKIFMILDSMGMLSTSKELQDMKDGSDKRDMTRAALLKATFRALTLRSGKADVPLFITNHVYDAIGQGPYAAAQQGGGTGAVYAASTELRLSKARDKDDDGAVSGSVITVTAHKSRFTKEQLKVKCLIRFTGGLDRYYWLTEIAEAAGIFKKVSTRYELPDGSKVFGKQLKEHPEKYFTKDILDQIDAWTQKNFKYQGMPTEHEEEDNEE